MKDFPPQAEVCAALCFLRNDNRSSNKWHNHSLYWLIHLNTIKHLSIQCFLNLYTVHPLLPSASLFGCRDRDSERTVWLPNRFLIVALSLVSTNHLWIIKEDTRSYCAKLSLFSLTNVSRNHLNTCTSLTFLHYFMDDLFEHRSHMIQLFGGKTDGNLHCFILDTQKEVVMACI